MKAWPGRPEMGVQEVVKGVYRVTPIPGVNSYLLETDGLTLIDTGHHWTSVATPWNDLTPIA
jgi:hypothetical protein